MINFQNNTLNGKPIIRWEVRFRTTLGFHMTVDEAVIAALSIEMPVEMIQAIPCAISEDTWEPK